MTISALVVAIRSSRFPIMYVSVYIHPCMYTACGKKAYYYKEVGNVKFTRVELLYTNIYIFIKHKIYFSSTQTLKIVHSHLIFNIYINLILNIDKHLNSFFMKDKWKRK